MFYAKAVLLDPVEKAEYQELAKRYGLRSAFTAVVTDYLKKPEIALIYSDKYTGAPGDVFFITTADDFKIKTMTVTLHHADGILLETGLAVPEQNQWKYVATQPNAVLPGTKIIVVAKDRTGNEVTKEKVL